MDLPGERRQPLVIALAGAGRFASGILMGTAMAVYVGRAASEFEVGLVLSAYFLGLMVFAPVWGAVADVTGRRRAVLVGTGALATLAVAPLAVLEGVWTQIGLRALYAVFAAGFAPVMLTIVSARGGASGRGRSIGFFNSARAVGFTGGQLTVGVLLGLLVPHELYLAVAGVSLLATLAVALVADPTPDVEGSLSLGALATEVRERLFPAVGDRGHLRTDGLRWLYVALALRNMTVLGVMSLMPIYLVRDVGVTEAVMGGILAFNPASQALFMLAFGRVADAWGRKPLIVAGMAGSGLFALVAAGAVVPAGQVPRIAVAVGAFLVIGAAFSSMTTGAIAFIGDVAPIERESELMGLRSTAKGVGGVTGPPLLGGVATVTGIQTAFAFGSVLALAAAGLAFIALSEPARAASGEVAPAVDD